MKFEVRNKANLGEPGQHREGRSRKTNPIPGYAGWDGAGEFVRKLIDKNGRFSVYYDDPVSIFCEWVCQPVAPA